jgi:membrane-bound serine protease (ClpP class)
MTALLLVLLVLGLVLLVAEAHLPTYGVLGGAGVAALAGAIVVAVEAAGGGTVLALALALPIAVAVGAVGTVAARKALAANRRRPRGGAEGLLGHVGTVRRPLDPLGHVLVDGELWRAQRSWAEEDEAPPHEGDRVVVEEVRGLTLTVRRAEEWELR